MADDSGTSLGQGPLRPWILMLLPSVGDLIFVAILGTLLCTPLSIKLLGDASIGWHIRAGQIIAATHAVPREDRFSSTMKGRAWFAWEWLYDLAVGQLERVAGLNGVVWLTAVVIAAVFSWTFRLLLERGVGLLLSVVLVLLAASASMVHFLARPHVFSWLFTVGWFFVLDSTERDARQGIVESKSEKVLWLLPALMLVWGNVHGGFLVGFVLLGIYWLSAAWTWARCNESVWTEAMAKLRAGRRAKRLLVVSVLSLLATLVNPYGWPYGWRLDWHIYRYLTNRFLINHIQEFQSPNFHGIAERCFAAMMLIALIALAAKKRRLRLSEGLVILFAVYSGLYAVRSLPVSSLLLALVTGPLLAEAVARLSVIGILRKLRMVTQGKGTSREESSKTRDASFLTRMKLVELNLRGHLWPIATAVVAFCIALNGGSLGSKRLMDAHFDNRRFPIEAVNHLEQGKSWGPILAPDYWGGYLIFRLYPKTQVVVDDRHDLYGEEILRSYVKTIHAERGWEDFLLQHEVCCVLAPKGTALANIMAVSGNWREIYRDETAIAFEKATGKTNQ